jgi:hypothetical protein
MTVSSPEFLMLEAIRDWMATLTVWQEWTELTGDDLKARVVWPLKDAPALPVCVLALKGGRTLNKTGAAGGSNFDPSGSIDMWIYAADAGGEDEQLGYTTFGASAVQRIHHAGNADRSQQLGGNGRRRPRSLVAGPGHSEMGSRRMNGLSEYMDLANLTCVGAGIILLVWIITRGVPNLIDRWENAEQRHEKAAAESRREFLTALDRQATARTEAAKSGHDAAMRLADNLHDLTEEVRRTNPGRPSFQHRPTSLAGGT